MVLKLAGTQQVVLHGSVLSAGAKVKVVGKDGPPETIVLDWATKSLILGMPAAFAPVCEEQLLEFLDNIAGFSAKGIEIIYVVTVNDVFVVQAWVQKMALRGTTIRFIADDKGEFTSSLGFLFDATEALGGLRSNRYALVVEDKRIVYLAVEEDSRKVTVTSASSVLSVL